MKMFIRPASTICGVFLLAGHALAAGVALPIEGYFERQTINGFGTHVTPEFQAQHREGWPLGTGFKNDFTGYHTAVDVEYTSPADQVADVPVRAIADGQVVYLDSLQGYGGLIIIRHQQPESVTSLYGHLRLSSAAVKVGDSVTTGQFLANLGSPYGAETSGARKHLHFAIHKGPAVNVNGYEQSAAAVPANWYDPNEWLRQHGASTSPSPTPSITASPAAPDEHKGWLSSLWDWLTGWLD